MGALYGSFLSLINVKANMQNLVQHFLGICKIYWNMMKPQRNLLNTDHLKIKYINQNKHNTCSSPQFHYLIHVYILTTHFMSKIILSNWLYKCKNSINFENLKLILCVNIIICTNPRSLKTFQVCIYNYIKIFYVFY